MWFIEAVRDYHELDASKFFLPSKTKMNCIELGCFYLNFGNVSHSLYFGLYYTGTKPAKKDVVKKLQDIAFIYDSFEVDELTRNKDITEDDVNWENK
jgi:hypothetical protein